VLKRDLFVISFTKYLGKKDYKIVPLRKITGIRKFYLFVAKRALLGGNFSWLVTGMFLADFISTDKVTSYTPG
jgi:hypothetical protein